LSTAAVLTNLNTPPSAATPNRTIRADQCSCGAMATPGGKSRDLFDNQESQLRYEAYSRLQAAAVAFGDSCTLPIPEIVAIGGQSDGKSSLMEAFLGVSDISSISHGQPACRVRV
jgi:hypothetical protein